MKRKPRRLEKKLTRIVDGEGRVSAESVIDTQMRELIEDVAELLAKAVKRNPDNPLAGLQIDGESQKQARKLLKKLFDAFPANLSPGQKAAKATAVRRVNRTVNRLDISYLASAANLSARQGRRLATLMNAVKDGIRGRWNEAEGSAVPSSKNRKFVPAVRSKKLREDAKLLNGRQLRTKVLNVVELRLERTDPALGGPFSNLPENAVRVTNALHSTLRRSIDVALDALKTNPAITVYDLEKIVHKEIAPQMGASRNAAKVASRAVVSSTLNNSIVDEVTRLVSNGAIPNTAFYLNRPAVLYKAVMDLRTSDRCRMLNGLVIPLDDKARLVHYMPPQHANCRSILIPNFR